MADKKERSKVYAFVLYTDNADHMKARDLLFGTYASVGILHNRDWYTEDTESHKMGEVKKEHYHILVRFKNARYKCSVAKELGIEERHIERVKNFRSYATYLTHKDIPDKAQYSIDELQGNLKQEVIKLLVDDSEDTQMLEIINLINSHSGFIDINQFTVAIIRQGYYATFRRSWSIVNAIIAQHNSLCS